MKNLTRAVWRSFWAGILLAGAASAEISSYGANVVKQVNAMVDSVKPNDDFQAGKVAGREAEARQHLQQVEQVLQQCTMQLRLLIRDSREPQVVAATKRVAALEAYADSVKKGLQNAGQSNEQLTQMVFPFIQEHLAEAQRVAGNLFNLHRFPESNSYIADLNQLKAAVAKLQAVDEACKGKYKPVANQPHPHNDANLEPRAWCQVAAKRQELSQENVRRLATGSFSVFINEIKRMKEQLESREGFLQTDITPIRKALWERDVLEREMREQYKAHFEAVGLTDTANLLAPLDPAINDLMTEVNRLAPKWKFSAAGPHDAGPEGMARAQVTRGYAGAAVRATVMQDPVFKITKNRLGIPLERYKDGYVFYKVASEKLCRQQAFSYYEKFDGTGYQRPSGVQLNYVRYLNCQ